MTKINYEIFKTYDIRGKYPEDLNKKTFQILVRAFIKVFNPKRVVTAHDPLEGSCEMYKVLNNSFVQNGVDVFMAGETSSPMLYYASKEYSVPIGLMLTASHAGIGKTGIKIIENGVPPSKEKVLEIKKSVEAKSYEQIGPKGKGEVIKLTDLYKNYYSKVLSLIGELKNPKRYKIVFDCSNGPNSHVIGKITSELNLDYILINNDIRRKNLAHNTNPKIKENRLQLAQAVIKHNADLGVIWDGDCDRAYFLDWEGEVVPPEFVGGITGSYLISSGKGSKITCDVRGSRAVEDLVDNVGGGVKRIRAWHVPIKYEMLDDPSIVFGMETSGHYVFRDQNRTDDGLLASLMFIKALDARKENFREILGELRNKYKIIEEINFKIECPPKRIFKRLEIIYNDSDPLKVDGLTIEYPDWRFNLRSSLTEPLLRLNISGTDFLKVENNLKKIEETIKSCNRKFKG